MKLFDMKNLQPDLSFPHLFRVICIHWASVAKCFEFLWAVTYKPHFLLDPHAFRVAVRVCGVTGLSIDDRERTEAPYLVRRRPEGSQTTEIQVRFCSPLARVVALWLTWPNIDSRKNAFYKLLSLDVLTLIILFCPWKVFRLPYLA